MHEIASGRGLRFECQQCSFCCTGSPGFVWLCDADIAALSDFFSIDADEFSRVYCRSIEVEGGRALSLREKQGYDCVFLEAGRCSVYSARPLQCRTYPFWEEILETETSWKAEAAYCPGIGLGSLVQPERIAEAILEMRSHPRRVFVEEKIEARR